MISRPLTDSTRMTLARELIRSQDTNLRSDNFIIERDAIEVEKTYPSYRPVDHYRPQNNDLFSFGTTTIEALTDHNSESLHTSFQSAKMKYLIVSVQPKPSQHDKLNLFA